VDPTPTTRHAADAIGSALRVLLGVSGADSVSLWGPDAEAPEPLGVAGASETVEYDLRRAAQALLDGDPVVVPAHLSATVIELDDGERAALLAHDPTRPAGAHDSLLRTARSSLAGLLRRRGRPAHGVERRSEAAAAERQLARLRFDLHDGPQQEIHLLAQDLALFREQLEPMLASHPDRDRAVGRLDDLEAQLVALDDDLRRLATSVRSPLLTGSLDHALLQVAEAYTARTGIVPRTELTGDVDSLTDSQQIALLSLVREALANARQHAAPENVAITIRADEDTIAVEVRDDGSGFDPARTGPRAAQGGHLGLVGMRERMRMLGGRTEITSTPGSGTVVSAQLPRWPVDAEPGPPSA
jgi:signal transduction histidine kinase